MVKQGVQALLLSRSCETVNLGKFFLFVVAVPPMLNYASLRQERDFLTANTTQYDVGFGQKLYLSCVGEGAPTVILDAPTGLTSDSWSAGVSELSAVTRVCVYDRAGLGWSDSPPRLNRSDPGEARYIQDSHWWSMASIVGPFRAWKPPILMP